MFYRLGVVACRTSILCIDCKFRQISLLSSLLATCGIGWASVDLRTIASASESQITGGSLVTDIKVPSKPYVGSKITLIFLPTFFSSIWNMVGGNVWSGMMFAN